MNEAKKYHSKYWLLGVVVTDPVMISILLVCSVAEQWLTQPFNNIYKIPNNIYKIAFPPENYVHSLLAFLITCQVWGQGARHHPQLKCSSPS